MATALTTREVVVEPPCQKVTNSKAISSITPAKINVQTIAEKDLEELDIPSIISSALEEYNDISSIISPLEECDGGEDEFGFVSDSMWALQLIVP
jgi:hypothetical protein